MRPLFLADGLTLIAEPEAAGGQALATATAAGHVCMNAKVEWRGAS